MPSPRRYKSGRTEDISQSKLADRTFNPLQMIDLRHAIKERMTECELQGRKFVITYYEEKFYIKPMDGFAPCGYITYDRIEDGV